MAACSSSSLAVCSVRKWKTSESGKRVLLGQRDVDAVVGRGGLQLEVEAAAEALAQRQAPGLVDAAAEGRVQDQLHAAALVEEALGDDGVLRRHRAEHRAAVDDVGDELQRGGAAQMPQLVHAAMRCMWRHRVLRRGCAPGRRSQRAIRDRLAQVGDAVAEDGGSLRRLAFPEGHGGRRAVGVFDQDAALRPRRAARASLCCPAGSRRRGRSRRRSARPAWRSARSPAAGSRCRARCPGWRRRSRWRWLRAPRRGCSWPCTPSRRR